MSTSRFKSYIECGMRQQAIDLGFWSDNKSSIALLVGNYLHTYFEDKAVHQAFVEAHQDRIITSRGVNKGKPKSEFATADRMIKALEEQPLFNSLYHGLDGDTVLKECIVTGELSGIPFKGKIDSLNLSGGYFTDIKTMQSIQGGIYTPSLRSYTTGATYNIFEYRYHLQMYVYQQLLFQQYKEWFTPYIVAVSKEAICDKEIILIDDEVLENGKQLFERYAQYVREVMRLERVPLACGHCDYCLHGKELVDAKTLAQLETNKQF